MSNQLRIPGGGIGFFGLLAILSIGLKLVGVINWSWIWVLFPLWIDIVAIISIGLGMLCVRLAIEAIRLMTIRIRKISRQTWKTKKTKKNL